MKWLWWLCLSEAAAEDVKYRQISLEITGLWLAPGLFCLFFSSGGLKSHLPAFAVGIVMLILSKATCGAIGAGDGLFFLLTACYLNFRETAFLFLAGLAVSFLWSTYLLLKGWISGSSNLHQSVPFLACVWLPGLWIACH